MLGSNNHHLRLTYTLTRESRFQNVSPSMIATVHSQLILQQHNGRAPPRVFYSSLLAHPNSKSEDTVGSTPSWERSDFARFYQISDQMAIVWTPVERTLNSGFT